MEKLREYRFKYYIENFDTKSETRANSVFAFRLSMALDHFEKYGNQLKTSDQVIHIVEIIF